MPVIINSDIFFFDQIKPNKFQYLYYMQDIH